MRYLVTTDVLFLTDNVSVSRGVFDSNDIEGVDDALIQDKCKQHPKDIQVVSEQSVAMVGLSKIERSGKPVLNNVEVGKDGKPSTKAEEKKAPAAPAAPSNDSLPSDPQDPAASQDGSETHPKPEAVVTINEMKAFLKEKKVEFDNKATKEVLYKVYVEAANKA